MDLEKGEKEERHSSIVLWSLLFGCWVCAEELASQDVTPALLAANLTGVCGVRVAVCVGVPHM